jgi:hypothetical protein
MPPASVPIVAMMHEDVHQGTGGQQQIGKDAENMGGVLRQQEKGGDCQEPAEHQPEGSSPPRRFRLFAHNSTPALILVNLLGLTLSILDTILTS